MNLDINNLVRSAAIGVGALIIGLPLANLTNATSKLVSVSTAGLEQAAKPSKTDEVKDKLVGDLIEPCLKYMLSPTESKLERTAMNEIEEVFGGDVNFRETCKWILN
tara:strand:- start:101 stop:421 length:321 start_codon:yes stop_codon:yes gene_type:complete